MFLSATLRKLSLLLLLILTLAGFRSDKKEFSGLIVYKNSFTTLQGQDISEKLAPYLGAEHHYYISGNNYKTYNEKKQLIQLYTGATNEYAYFKDGQLAQKMDAAQPSSTDVKVTLLPQGTTILGYPCKALQLVADGVTTMYYYTPALKVNPEAYAQHQFGDWYTYMKATQGAIMLKYVVTNPKVGYVMTSEATAIRPLPMTTADFTVTAAEPQ